jgi:hypothetical protein
MGVHTHDLAIAPQVGPEGGAATKPGISSPSAPGLRRCLPPGTTNLHHDRHGILDPARVFFLVGKSVK